MRKGKIYDREDVIHDVARHLSFARVRDTVREPVRSATNAAVRHGFLARKGPEIWRAD
jgi:hypothetical protein